MPLETREFHIQNYLKTPEQQTAFLEAAFEESDPTFLAEALGEIAKARGVTAFAEEAGLSREAIYKAFRKGGNPTLVKLSKATKALGLRLTVVPA